MKKNYTISKIRLDKLVKKQGKTWKTIPLKINFETSALTDEAVDMQLNQVINILDTYFSETNESYRVIKKNYADILISVFVPSDGGLSKKQSENAYRFLALNGFDVNGKHYVRLASGSGQIRRNTIVFIRSDLKDMVESKLLCGLDFADFGDDFNCAKFNAYFGLGLSGVSLLPNRLTPNVCIVADFEQIKPHMRVNHVTERAVNYITLPDTDFVLEDDQTQYEIQNGRNKKAIRKSDGKTFSIHRGIKKQVKSAYYDQIENAPCINSFDGQGLSDPRWVQSVSEYLDLGFMPSCMVVRACWVKGLIATIDFKSYFKEIGISEITDMFGGIRKVEDLDLILSASQFKMAKIYAKKCSDLGINAWDYHVSQMRKNNLLWGIVKANNEFDDFEKTLNYQYVEALDLGKEDVEKLCQRTQEYIREINSNDIEAAYRNLIYRSNDESENDENETNHKKIYQRAIELNPEFLNDKYIRKQIYKESEKKIRTAKLAKLLVRGNYQFCISDPIAQLEWIAKNHGGKQIEVNGIIKAGEIYSNYWLAQDDKTDEIVLLRSPLIDRNEIAKRRLIQNENKYFRYLQSGIILSVHDLTALGLGGCDFDGDILFSTNDQIIAKGCYSFEEQRPLYYSLDSSSLNGCVDLSAMIEADIRGLNSQVEVGAISNKATILYAKLSEYPQDSIEYKRLYESIVFLGQIVGMEIDRIKTGVPITYDISFTTLQIQKQQYMKDDRYGTELKSDDEETQGQIRHNALVPDVKPYFMRYNYSKIDADLKQLDSIFDKDSKANFGCSFSSICEKEANGEVTEHMQKRIEKYRRMRQTMIIDNECIVNQIAHIMESFESEVRKTINEEGVNMLSSFVSIGFKPDKKIMEKILFFIAGYKKMRYRSTRNINMMKSLNQSEIEKLMKEHRQNVRKFFILEILNVCDGDFQKAFDYVVRAVKGEESLAWELLDNIIFEIIGRKKKDNND